MKIKKWNKKGLAFAPLLWGAGAAFTGLGYLFSQLRPDPTGITAIPIWGWVVGGVVLLILLRK